MWIVDKIWSNLFNPFKSPEVSAFLLGLLAVVVYLKYSNSTTNKNPALTDLRATTSLKLKAIGSLHPLSPDRCVSLWLIITKTQLEARRILEL